MIVEWTGICEMTEPVFTLKEAIAKLPNVHML